MWLKMNKAIFIDLDGTLLNDDHKISAINIKAIRKAQSKHFNIYLVTGKSINHSWKFYEQLHLKTWLITSAGQVISKGKKIIWQKNLLKKHIDKLLIDEQLSASLKDFIVQTNESIYTTNINSPVIRLFYEKNVKISDFGKSEKIEKIIGLYLNLNICDIKKRWIIIEKLNKKWKKWFEFHPWEMIKDVFIVHVVPARINKWSAIEKVIKWDQLDYIVAFGNGRNDIPMLKKANVSFAMKNASDEVQFFGKNVTLFDNNNSGVGEALMQFLKK